MAPPLTLQMEEIFIHKHVAMQPPLQLRAKETKRIFRYKNKLLLAYFHLCEQQKPLIVLFFSLLEHWRLRRQAAAADTGKHSDHCSCGYRNHCSRGI